MLIVLILITLCYTVSTDVVSKTKNIIASFNTSPNATPFIDHVKFFENNNDLIDIYSISKKWTEISGRFAFDTLIRGSITIQGANYADSKCPYKKLWNSQDIMKALKHPCDTNIVNNDGSINIDNLLSLIEKRFKFSNTLQDYILTQSSMNENIKESIERDNKHTGYNYDLWNLIFLPTYSQVAQAEWDEFFNIFSDYSENGELAVTLDTFLQFYFYPRLLNNRTLLQLQ